MIAPALIITLLGLSAVGRGTIIEYLSQSLTPNVAAYKVIEVYDLLNCARRCNYEDCELFKYVQPTCTLFKGTGLFGGGSIVHYWRKDLGCYNTAGVLLPHGTRYLQSEDCLHASCLLGKSAYANPIRTICDGSYTLSATLGCVSLLVGRGTWCNRRLKCSSNSDYADLLMGVNPADIRADLGNLDLWVAARGTTWADGQLIPSAYWAPGHPSSDPKACVMVKNGKFQHANCSTSFQAACQRKGAT